MDTNRGLTAYISAVLCSLDKQCLLIQRSPEASFSPGTWECVTGRLNMGESFQEGLFREVREETNLSILSFALLGTSHFFRGQRARDNEMIGVCYIANVQNFSELRLSPEHSDHKILSLPEASLYFRNQSPRDHWQINLFQRASFFLQNNYQKSNGFDHSEVSG